MSKFVEYTVFGFKDGIKISARAVAVTGADAVALVAGKFDEVTAVLTSRRAKKIAK